HLALWVGGRGRIPTGSPLRGASPLPVLAAVSLAGVGDLRVAFDLSVGGLAVRELMGGTPADAPDRYAAGSPADLLPLGTPQVVVHGTVDAIVPYELSQRYVTLAQAKGEQVDLITLS